MRLGLVLVGDSPRTSTGLGRIARDLAGLIWDARADLDVSLLQIGLEDQSVDPAWYPPWPFLPVFHRHTDWCAG